MLPPALYLPPCQPSPLASQPACPLPHVVGGQPASQPYSGPARQPHAIAGGIGGVCQPTSPKPPKPPILTPPKLGGRFLTCQPILPHNSTHCPIS